MVALVGVVGVARSEWNKLPIFMSYNPFLQINGITLKAYPFLLMVTTSTSSAKNIYDNDIFILHCFYTQMSLVADSFLCALFISPHFVPLDRHNF
jgi:hypothetical protein